VNTANLYKADGVDVEAGDAFSEHAGTVCRGNWKNSPFVEVYDLSDGFFRGVRGFRLRHLPRGYLIDKTSDGSGTKVVLSAAAGLYRQAACDLLAMCSTDLTRNGGMSLVFNNVLDVKSLGEPGTPQHQAFIQLIEGLGDVAKQLASSCSAVRQPNCQSVSVRKIRKQTSSSTAQGR